MSSGVTSDPSDKRRGVLVVEDEMLINMMIEDMLSELGHEVISATSLEQALDRIKAGGFDVAIVDLNLSGVPSYAAVDALQARGTPFIIATGYGERGLPEKYSSAPLLPKPFDIDKLKKALAQV